MTFAIGGIPHAGPRKERIPHLERRGGNAPPVDVGGTILLILEWRRVCRGTY